MAQQHAVAFLALTIFAIMPIATSEEACGDIKGCAAYPQTRDNVLLQMKGSLDLSPKNEEWTTAATVATCADDPGFMDWCGYSCTSYHPSPGQTCAQALSSSGLGHCLWASKNDPTGKWRTLEEACPVTCNKCSTPAPPTVPTPTPAPPTPGPQIMRYWRILNNADGIGCDGNRWNVKELQFFSGGTQLPTAKDANKAFSDSTLSRGPEWAFDGTANEAALGHSATHWSSAFGAGKTARVSYIGYDFGESVTVDGFKIMQYPTCGTSSVQVQFSDDKSTWSTAWTQETNAAGGPWEDFTRKAAAQSSTAAETTGRSEQPHHDGSTATTAALYDLANVYKGVANSVMASITAATNDPGCGTTVGLVDCAKMQTVMKKYYAKHNNYIKCANDRYSSACVEAGVAPVSGASGDVNYDLYLLYKDIAEGLQAQINAISNDPGCGTTKGLVDCAPIAAAAQTYWAKSTAHLYR